MKIISLGWGVQSFGLAAMSALDMLPKVDFAIHADTGWERTETMEFAQKWTPWLERYGVKVITVHAPRNALIADEYGGVFVPAFTTRPNGSPSGMLRRQCTNRWKIIPMRRWLSKRLTELGQSKSPGVVEQWLGFTLDESHRAKPGDVRYITNRFPYLEMLGRPWTRGMVIQWLREQGLEVPVKSSCIICPFHDDNEWRAIQMADNDDWKRAVEVDQAIRGKRIGYECYLCKDRKPLEDHDFTQQLSYW